MRTSFPGKNILLFLNEAPVQVAEEQPARKGRNAELVTRRNEKIADRLYFYRVLGKVEHDTALRILSDEFDLSAFTLGEITMGLSAYLRGLMKDEVTAKQLKAKWPYLDWSDNHPI